MAKQEQRYRAEPDKVLARAIQERVKVPLTKKEAHDVAGALQGAIGDALKDGANLGFFKRNNDGSAEVHILDLKSAKRRIQE